MTLLTVLDKVVVRCPILNDEVVCGFGQLNSYFHSRDDWLVGTDKFCDQTRYLDA